MKKLLALLLAAAVLLGAAFVVPSALRTGTQNTALQAGNTVEGFVLKETRDFPLVGATL